VLKEDNGTNMSVKKKKLMFIDENVVKKSKIQNAGDEYFF
jgi:hypothetical protein